MKLNSWLGKKILKLKEEVRKNQNTNDIIKLIDELFPITEDKVIIRGYCIICKKPILEGEGWLMWYKGSEGNLGIKESGDAHETCIKERDKEYYDGFGIPIEVVKELQS